MLAIGIPGLIVTTGLWLQQMAVFLPILNILSPLLMTSQRYLLSRREGAYVEEGDY